MNATITVLYNKKKGSFVRGNGKVPPGCVKGTVVISLDDFVTAGKVGFEALHEKLAMFAKIHRFELKGVLEQLATTNLFRITHILRDHAIPRFLAKEFFRLLIDGHACVWEGAAVRKTASYVLFLRGVVDVEKAVSSVHSGKTVRQRYVIPDNIGEMTIEMLQEELRVAEEIGARAVVMARLRRLYHDKQRENKGQDVQSQRKEERKRKVLSEVEQILADNRREEAEYDDMPKKKRRA